MGQLMNSTNIEVKMDQSIKFLNWYIPISSTVMVAAFWVLLSACFGEIGFLIGGISVAIADVFLMYKWLVNSK